MSFCGNDCESCRHREELKCSGCKAENNTIYYQYRYEDRYNFTHYMEKSIDPIECGECHIANCCSNRRMSSCDRCEEQASCCLYRGREFVVEDKLKSLNLDKADEKRIEDKSDNVKSLFKYLTFLIIPMTVLFILSFVRVGILSYFVFVLRAIILVAYAYVLEKMSEYTHASPMKKAPKIYKFEAVTYFILWMVLVAISYNTNNKDGFYLIISAIILILDGIAVLFECIGFSEVTFEVNKKVSNEWGGLAVVTILIYINIYILAIRLFPYDFYLAILLLLLTPLINLARVILIIRTNILLDKEKDK